LETHAKTVLETDIVNLQPSQANELHQPEERGVDSEGGRQRLSYLMSLM
jgi:hypothetical protein